MLQRQLFQVVVGSHSPNVELLLLEDLEEGSAFTLDLVADTGAASATVAADVHDVHQGDQDQVEN